MTSIVIRLLLDFLKIGFFSIGGGYAIIPLIQSVVVDTRHYLTVQQFTDIITISQMTPGPLAVNTSTFVGLQAGGLAGAIVATFGCVFSGFVISLLLLRFFDRYKTSVYGACILKGLKAASLGLIVSASVTITSTAFSSSISESGFNITALLFFLGAFGGIRILHLNPILVMILTGILGFFILY